MKYQCDKIRWFKNKFPETKRSTGSQPLNFLAILEIIGVNPRFSFATFSLPHVNKMRCGSGKLLHYSDYLRKTLCSTRGKWNANEMKMVLCGNPLCTGYKKGKKQETAENINVGRRLALSRKRVADHGYGIGASLYHGAERRLLREPEAASGTCLIIAFLGAFVHGFLSGRA